MLFDRAVITAALPSYEVGREVGRGGFGTVLEGRHRSLGRPVAIKVMAMPDPALERRFLAEARVMAAFDHPHVVHVHDYADSGGVCLLVMEHCPGGTLTDRLRFRPRPETACAIALSIADALHAAHQRGIVHRDVKPDNVLFAADGAAKVTDFGLAKIFEGTVKTSGSLVGTPGYAAPEQILGQQVRPATDVYALGGVVYHMLTGRPPFPTDLPVREMLLHQIYRGPELPGGLPARFAAVLTPALAREPAARTASAKEFAVALAAAAAAELGPDWATRADAPLRADEDILRALTGRPAATAPTATAPRRRGATGPRPGGGASGPRPGPDLAGRRPDLDLAGRRPDSDLADPPPGGGAAVGDGRASGRSGPDQDGGAARRGPRHAAPELPPPFPSGPAEPLTPDEVRRRVAAWTRDDDGFSRRTWLVLGAALAAIAVLSVVAGVVIGQLQRG